jgi:hypothetical protein
VIKRRKQETSIDLFAELAAEREKLVAVQEKNRDNERTIEMINSRLKNTEDRLHNAALAILDEGADPEEMSDIRSELEAAYKKRPALSTAISIASNRVEQLESKVRVYYGESRRAEYSEHVGKMAAALRDLRGLCIAEWRLREEINDGGGGCFPHPLTAMAVHGMAVEWFDGKLVIERIDRWLREAEEAGYL